MLPLYIILLNISINIYKLFHEFLVWIEHRRTQLLPRPSVLASRDCSLYRPTMLLVAVTFFIYISVKYVDVIFKWFIMHSIYVVHK